MWPFKQPLLFSGSILKTLIAVHMAVLGTGFLGLFFFLNYSTKNRIQSSVLTTKELVQPILSSYQDQWRAWSMLGLPDVLQQNLQAFQKQHPEVALSVEPLDPTSVTDNVLIFPADATAGETVVRAEILTEALASQLQLNQFATASVFLLSLLFVVSLVLSTYLIRKHIQAPLSELRRRVSDVKTNRAFSTRDIPATGEIKDLMELIDTLYERTRQSEKMSAVGEIAQQVAHDIRSPLSALNLAASCATSLPESHRRLIQSAIVRINDIANNLASRQAEPLAKKITSLPPQYMLSMLRDVLTEKRIEFSTESEIRFVETGLNQVRSAFVRVEPGKFKTLLSNLINNARDALKDSGTIEIKAEVEGCKLTLSIIDDGVGIPPEVRSRITERGFSFAKPNGSGLGLYDAQHRMTEWGGELAIDSTVGKGTSVKLEFPLVTAPDWFHDSLSIPDGADIVVVDDDPSIHELWKYRLHSRASSISMGRIHHFSTTDQLRKWWHDSRQDSARVVYLVDHEFVGQSETGLDLVEELGLGRNAYLVTSRSDDAGFVQRCIADKVRVIPKCTAEYVSIQADPKLSEVYA